jgi:hypothetical protein
MTLQTTAPFLNRGAAGWIETLEDPNPLLRRMACQALAAIWGDTNEGSDSQASVEVRRPFTVKVWGGGAAPIERAETRPSVAAVFAGLKDPIDFLRDRVARRLDRLGPFVLGSRLAAARLRSLLSDPDPGVREEASEALQRIQAPLN